MTVLILAQVFLAVSLAVVGAAMLLARRDRLVSRRVDELVGPGREGAGLPSLTHEAAPATGLRRLVTSLGKKVPASPGDVGDLRQTLMRAGYRDANGPLFYTGMRVLLAALLPLFLLLTVAPGMESARAITVMIGAAAFGYVLPALALKRTIRRRQLRITDALPDALDLLVVCVEAGLGLNQALMRVGIEIGSVEPIIAEEFNLVNLEMRAGKSRMDALKNLARRTGVDDLSSLVSMLVQTDKFGTSVASSLRVFSDGMRTKRRQKAEEAAAKTTIKMVFPLALCILPALFVVVVGPAALHIFEELIKNG